MYLLPLTILITTFLLFLVFLILNHYGIFFIFNSKASIFTSLSSPLTYLVIFLTCGFQFCFDYSYKIMKLFLVKSLSNKLVIKKSLQKRKKSSYSNNSKLNKSFSKHSKDKKTNNNNNNNNNCSNEDCSKNILFSNQINKLKQINQTHKSFFNSNFIPKSNNTLKFKVHESYKNDFYSLKILKDFNNRHSINDLYLMKKYIY